MNRMLVASYRSEEAVALLEPAMDELQGIDDEAALIRLAAAMIGAYSMHQDNDQALLLIDRYIGRAEHLDLVDVVANMLMRRGITLSQMGRGYEASALTRGALELAEAHGIADLAIACRGNLGFYLNERDPAQAIALDKETLAETRRLGMRQRMFLMIGNTSEEARATGEWDWALGELATQLAGELDRPDRAWFLGNTLLFRSWRGETNSEDWAEWDSLVAGHEDPQAVADYLDVRSLRALGEGRVADARQFAIESFTTVGGRLSRRATAARAALWSRDRIGAAEDLEAIDETGIHGPAAELRRTTIRAGIAALDGRTGEAIALFRLARDGWRDINLPWEEALVGIDMATLLDAREPEVQAAAARSREILTGLRARPFLDRLEAALATPDRAPTASRMTETETGDRAAV
jgi:hypothetical protein